MTVQNNGISPRISFAERVVMLVTWPETVLIGNVVRTGVMTPLAVLLPVDLLAALEVAMPSIGNTKYVYSLTFLRCELTSQQQLMQELSGGAPASGQAPQRIEGGPGGYENGGDGYGGGAGGDSKPWQRGPTGAAAPWQRGGDDRGRADGYAADGGAPPPWAGGGRGGDGYGYGQQGGYGAPPGPPGGAAPWQAPPPPPGGTPAYGGYGGYPGGGYGDSNGGYPPQPGMGAPPGLAAGGLGAPPGLGALFQYNGNGAVGTPPPPPPGDAPPPVSSLLPSVRNLR